jgi:hypothetical protein
MNARHYPYRAIWLFGATVRALCTYPRIFALGFAEGRGYDGMTYDDDPESPRSVAYDLGRNLRRLGR